MKIIDDQFVVETKAHVPIERVVDLLTTAMEGGSNYWVAKIDVKNHVEYECVYTAMIENGFKLTAKSGRKEHAVFPNDVMAALQLMANDQSKHFEHFMNENEDATTGDVFLQLCVFKDVIYG